MTKLGDITIPMSTAIWRSLVKIEQKTKFFYQYAKFWHYPILNCDATNLERSDHFLWPSKPNCWLGSYLLHPKTFHPRTLILNFSSLPFILNNSSFLFNPLDFSFTNSSPPFYPTPCNLFQIICYISYPLNSYSSKWDLLFHTFNLIRNISSSSNQSLDFISLT